jgi:hypothetical protein
MIKIHLYVPDFYFPERNGLWVCDEWFGARSWRAYVHAWLKLPRGQALPLEEWLPDVDLRFLESAYQLPRHMKIHCCVLPL